MTAPPRRLRWPCLGLLLLGAALAGAHPLGNHTINRAAHLDVGPDALVITYALDLAELPTLLATGAADRDGDGAVDDAEWDVYARTEGAAIRDALRLRDDGGPLPLSLAGAAWRLTDGVAGLRQLRLDLILTAPPPRSGALAYRDHWRPDAAGWQEVTARGADGVVLHAQVPADSPSRGLTAWPPGPPSRVLQADLAIQLPEPAVADRAQPPQAARSRRGAAGGAAAPHPDLPATAADPPQPAARPTPFGFLRLGIAHLANGLDHLVLLLGLIAAEHRPQHLLWIITAFTAAHSLALGLAAAGLVVPPAAWVGPAIGLTILYVGLAALTGRLRHGVAVAFGFGLVHGLGFAGGLAGQLAPDRGPGWLLDLAAFNLGVEVAQLAFLLLVLLLLRASRQLEIPWPRWSPRLSGGLVSALGACWVLPPSP